MVPNRRHFHRYAGLSGKTILASEPGRGPFGAVEDLSCDGVTVLLSAENTRPSSLNLCFEDVTTPCSDVEMVQQQGQRIGLRLRTRDPIFLGRMSRILARVHPPAPGQGPALPWAAIAEKDRLLLLCRALGRNHVTARVETVLGERLGKATLHRVRPKLPHLVADWEWEVDRRVDGPCYLFFEGHHALYRMRAEEVHPHEGLMRTMGPAMVERLRQRRFPRVAPLFPIELRFDHPLSGRTICKEVADLTYDGLGFAVDVEQDLLFHELRLPHLRLILPNGFQLRASGQVCHNYERRREGTLYCGVRLEQMPPWDKQSWHRLVQRHLVPQVSAADPGALAAMWEHYTNARYFSLSGKCPEYFQRQEEPFRRVWSRINAASGVGQLSVWLHDEKVVGTLTTIRAYQGTMLIQGLATRGLPGEAVPGKGTISRDLYFSVFHQAICDESIRYMLAYLCLGSAKRWHEVLCEEFAREHPRWACAHHFYLMEGAAGDPEPSGLPLPDLPDLEVGPLLPEETRWLTEEALTPLLRDALDYHPARLDLGPVNRRLSEVDIVRRRRLFGARSRGSLVALAVLETGGEGINPYHLLDCARILGPDEGHPLFQTACLALLRRVRRELGLLHGSRMVLFASPAVRLAGEDAGFATIDEGMCWVLHKKGFASYLSHIYEIIAPD